MARKLVTIDSLGELDSGAAGLIIDSALQRAIDDLDDRGEDGQPRRVVIQISFKRLDNGETEIIAKAAVKVPEYKTHKTFARTKQLKGGGVGLEFQPSSPENPDQATMDFETPKK